MSYPHTTPPRGYRPHSPSASIRDRQDLFTTSTGKAPVQLTQQPSLGTKGLQIANQMLHQLAQLLQCTLSFDNQHTTVLDYGGRATVLITYDGPTERLYVYSTLLSTLPKDPKDKLALYEYLLEGCLLGRDMAGGGVGISLKDGFCLMCTSFDLRNSELDALRSVVPGFVSSLLEWRSRVQCHSSVIKMREQNQVSSMVPEPSYSHHAEPPSPSQDSVTGPPKSKALLIGIDYTGTSIELGGCCEDARALRGFLQRNGFDDPSNVLILSDDNVDPSFHPTKANILSAMRWLVQDVTSQDSVFFSFSGIARQEQGLSSDEDGNSQFFTTICPSDHQQYGSIPADVVYETMIRPLPPHCAFNAIMDCYNSLFDLCLPWVYVGDPSTFTAASDKPQMVPAVKGRAQVTRQQQANTKASVCVLACCYRSLPLRKCCHFTNAFVMNLTKQPTQNYYKLVHNIGAQLQQQGQYTHSAFPCLYSTAQTDLFNLYFM